MMIRPILPLYIIIPIAIFIVIAAIFCIINKKYRKLSSLRRILIFVFLLVVLIRPCMVGGESEQATTNITIFFVIDNTNSMAVEDMNSKTRLAALKDDAENIIKTVPGARYAIFVQDHSTYNLMPVSTDTNAAITSIKALKTKDSYYSAETDLYDLLSFANDRIDRYSKKHEESQNVLIFMSDGENTKSSKTNISNSIFKNISTGFVIGYGSTAGEKVPYISSYTIGNRDDAAIRYLSCGSNSCISALDESTLKTIAEAYKFEYALSSGTNGKAIAEKINNTIKSNIEVVGSKKITSYVEFYWVFALIALALIMWEFYACFNGFLSEREVTKK